MINNKKHHLNNLLPIIFYNFLILRNIPRKEIQ